MDTAVFPLVIFPLIITMLGTPAAGRAPVPGPLFDIQLHLQIDPSIGRTLRLAELHQEVEEIWQPYGVRIIWSDSPPQAESFPLTAMLGSDMEQRGLSGAPLVLGRAVVGPGDRPIRPIRFSVAAIEEALALRPHAWTGIAGHAHEREVARALGRVLAHEIGHVLLALRTHDQTGLMRATFTPDQLAGVDRSAFSLTPNSVGRLRSRIDSLRMQDGAAHLNDRNE